MWSTLRSAATWPATDDNPNGPEAAAAAVDPSSSIPKDHEKEQQQEKDLETQPSAEDLDTLLALDSAPTLDSQYTADSEFDVDLFGMTESEDTTVQVNQTSQSFDNDDDYVPPELADFVKKANQTLKQQQTEFMSSISPEREAELELESPAGSPQYQIREDAHDKELKGQVLDRLGANNKSVAPTSNTSAKSSSSSPQYNSNIVLEGDLLGALGVSNEHVAVTAPKTSTKKSRSAEDNVLMSPDLLLTPQPNPTFGITDSEAKQQALEGCTPFVPASTAKSFAARLEEEQQPEEMLQLISETIQESPVRGENSTVMSPNSTFDLTPRSLQPADATPSSVPSVNSSAFAIDSDASMEESPQRREASTPTSTLIQSATPSSVQSVNSSNISVSPEAASEPEVVHHLGDVKDESVDDIDVQLAPSPAEEIPTTYPAPETVEPKSIASSVRAPSPPEPVAPAPAPGMVDAVLSPVTLPTPVPVQAATSSSSKPTVPDPKRAPAASRLARWKATPSPKGIVAKTPSSRASTAATPSPRVPVAATPSSRTSAAATPSSRASSSRKTTPNSTASLDRLSRPTSASASRDDAKLPVSGDTASPQVPDASSTPTPSFVDRLSQPTPPPPDPASAAATTSSRASSSGKMTPNSTASLERLSRPTSASASRDDAKLPVSGDTAFPQVPNASPTPSFVDRLSQPTPPPSDKTPNATASADRASRSTSASGSSEVTTPASGSKSSPQTPAFVDRLSRPTVSSAARTPPLHNNVETTVSGAETVAASVRTESSSTTGAPPMTKIPVVPARAVRPANFSKPKSASASNRLSKGTAASQARSTEPTDNSADARSAALAEDRLKARERVRQRMLQQKQQQTTASVKGTTSQNTQSSKASIGMAQARERVRQKQLLQKASSEKENRVRTSTTSVRSSTGRASMGATRPRVTIPHGPKFAIDAKYGEKQLPRRDEPTLAQSGDIMRKGLRGEDKGPYTRSGKTGLTIPQAPKFATSKRHADKASAQHDDRSLAESSDYYAKHLRDDMTVGSASSIGSHSHSLTIPRGPNFATTAKFGEKPRTPRASTADIYLAQSSDLFGKALRDGKNPAPSVKREGPTIPQSPKFQVRAKRAVPMSTEEKEAEMMEYNLLHPFRANPVLTHGGSLRPPTKPSKRRMTSSPAPSHFRREESDSKEMQKQFRASPMPTFSQPAKRQTVRAKVSTKAVTTPEPFSLSSDRRVQTEKRAYAAPDDIELTKKFHARAVPQSTYVPPASYSTTPGAPTLASQAAKPFTMHSSLRHEAYQKQLAEKVAQEEAERRAQMAFHARSFKATPPPERIRADHGPTEPCPFPLSSIERHAAFERETNEKLAAQEEDRMRQAAFKATPAPKSTYEPKVLSPIEAVLATRHETMEREKLARLAAEEEEYRRQSTFKAKPVPKSTYVYKAISPKASELVDPFSPLLQSKQRAEDRKSFDAKAYRQRMLDEGRRREQKERIAAEEKADLDERRRLPVSEGGMIPMAAPVNAIFFPKD